MDSLNEYVRSRLIAENMVLAAGREERLPAVAMCVSTTRELGWQPMPVEESIRVAARWWVQLRAEKRRADS
jgi:dihydroflavonol-4-reductase